MPTSSFVMLPFPGSLKSTATVPSWVRSCDEVEYESRPSYFAGSSFGKNTLKDSTAALTFPTKARVCAAGTSRTVGIISYSTKEKHKGLVHLC